MKACCNNGIECQWCFTKKSSSVCESYLCQCHGSGMEKTPQNPKTQAMHNSSSVIKMMIAVQWLLLVLLGGTSGSSEQNVKTSGFKTSYKVVFPCYKIINVCSCFTISLSHLFSYFSNICFTYIITCLLILLTFLLLSLSKLSQSKSRFSRLVLLIFLSSVINWDRAEKTF